MISDKFKKEEYEFQTYFGNWRKCKFDSNKYQIVFSPLDRNWNDFKLRSSYDFKVFDPLGNEVIRGITCLGFIESHELIGKDNTVKLEEELIPASRLPDYFTLLGGMTDYRTWMVSYDKPDLARAVLKGMNDLVELKKRSNKSILVESAEKTDVFKRAFMRNADKFFAYHNAESILDGLMGEDLSAMSSNLLLKYELDSFNNELKINLKFNQKSILPKRINVLIGENGLGKSQALMAISRALLYDVGSFTDENLERPMISRLLAIVSPGIISGSFPPERSTNKRIKYRKINLVGNKPSKSSQGFGDSIMQLSRSEEEISGRSRWDIFTQLISFMPEFDNAVVEVGERLNQTGIVACGNKNYIRISNIRPRGEQDSLDLMGAILKKSLPENLLGNKIIPYSSGQLSFISFAVQACLFVENGTLVLLDEPETHMHPNYISDFMRLLDTLLSSTGSFAVIATHSAYVVREVPREQVHIFKRNDDECVEIVRPRLKTFGADVGSISYFVFDDDITNNLVKSLEVKLSTDKTELTQQIDELKEDLSSDVIMYLRRKLGVVNEKD